MGWFYFKTEEILFFIIGVSTPLFSIFIKYDGPFIGAWYAEKRIRTGRQSMALYFDGVCQFYYRGIIGTRAPNDAIGLHAVKYFSAFGIWPVIFYRYHAK